jgi:hypothetical protein
MGLVTRKALDSGLDIKAVRLEDGKGVAEPSFPTSSPSIV